jgi:hypothetical protein
MSEVKVNKISPRSGTTVTLGDSGDTFTIPSGATINNQGTATNFGATGSASWTTTVKTSGFTAVAGEGYFVDTTSGAISVNLPAGTAGAVVAFKDYLGTFDTNELTLVQNGTDKIGGSTVNATLGVEGIAVTLVFIDSTQGWLVTDSGLQSESPTAKFVTATGGTIATCGNFKTHTFTGPGTFCVSCAGNAGGSTTVDYLVVAGGGGGGRDCYPGGTPRQGGGGGAGGFRVSNTVGCIPAPTMSPLIAPAGITVTATGFPIAVGGGGAGGTPTPPSGPGICQTGASGTNSSFSTITSAGGGGGIGHSPGPPGGGPFPEMVPRMNGGSGGGAGTSYSTPVGNTGQGNTPPVSPPQGQNGGVGGCAPQNFHAGGGGGAGAVGGSVSGTSGCGSTGGIGSFVSPLMAGSNGQGCGPVSSTRYFAGGGGAWPARAGGTGGGGGGGGFPTTAAGTTNTGGGGGGNRLGNGGAGGSGIVIIRYKFQ